MDIGSLTGQIALEDQISDKLTIVASNVKQFAEEVEGAFGAAALTVGVLTAAIVGMTISIVELGEKGSDINDVTQTLEHFAGSAEHAEEIITKMRDGLQGTVGDFDLAKDASRLLSAGVKLSADQFGELTKAAFVLQNRGLGSTKEMMDLVTSSMITGRTRALAMKLGVVDVADSTLEFARSLGLEKDQLNAAGLAEGKRLGVMKLLEKANKDAGEQTRDFGEQLEFARAKIENWADELASAVAKSPHVMAAVTAIGDALQKAFGGSGKTAMDAIIHAVNEFSDGVVHWAPIVIGWMGKVKDGIVSIYDFLAAHEAEIKAFTLGVLAYATTWALLTVGGQIVTGVTAGLKAIQLSMGVLSAPSLLALVSPIGLIAVAVGGLAAAVYLFHKNLDELKNSSSGTSMLDPALEQKNKDLIALAAGQKPLTAGTSINIHAAPGTEASSKPKTAADYTKDQSEKINEVTNASIAKTEAMWGQYYQAIDQMEGDSLDAKIRGIDRTEAAELSALEKTKKYNQDYENQKLAIQSASDAKRLGAEVAFLEKQYQLEAAGAADRHKETLKEFDVTFAGLMDAQHMTLSLHDETDKMVMERTLTSFNMQRELAMKDSRDKAAKLIADGVLSGDAWDELERNILEHLANITTAEQEAGSAFGKDFVGPVQQAVDSLGTSLKKDLRGVLDGVPQTIVDGLTGGGGLIGAAAAIGSQIGSVLGKNIGKALGSMGGPIGAAIGSLLGPAISGLAYIFSGGAEHVINPLRDAFIKDQGELDALNKKAHDAGTTLDELLHAKNQDQLQKAIDHLNEAFAKTDKLLADQKQYIDTANQSLNGFLQSAVQLGVRLPASLQAAIDKQRELGHITDDNKDLLDQLMSGTTVGFKQMESIASKYGVDLDKLGPKFEALRVKDKATDIINDFETLRSGLGDTDEALTVLAKPINEVLNQALKFGTALPENMRPWIEQLAKTHQLVDENGDEIKDLSKLKFADPIVTEFDKIIAKIQELIDKIAKGLPAAVSAGVSGSAAAGSAASSAASGFLPGDTYEPPPPPAIGMASGTGGIARTKGPTLIYSAGNEDFWYGGEGRSTPFPGGNIGGNTTITNVDVNPTIYLTSDDAKDPERVLQALEDGLRRDTRGIRTKIEKIADKRIAAA